MPVQLSYGAQKMGALPGRISDTSLYNVDGSRAAQGAITPGKFVFAVSTDVNGQGRVVSQVASAGNVATIEGLAIHSHYENVAGDYATGDSVNVLTFGRAWALFTGASAPVQKSAVSVTADGNASSTGTALAGCTFTGAYLPGTVMMDGTTVNIAEIQIRDLSQAAPAA